MSATARVPSGKTRWGDSTIKRGLTSGAATYYPGAMISIISSTGYATKSANTSGHVFDGLVSNSVNVTVASADSSGDILVDVDRPFAFEMAIPAAVAGDVGRAVYVYDDLTVDYSTANSILVGWVDKVISATVVLIRPVWVGQRGSSAFDGATLTFNSTSTNNNLVMPDNLADAFSIEEGSNKYLTFVTTDAAELINVLKTMKFGGTTGNNIIKMVDNLADALNIKEGTNSYLKFTTTDSGEVVVIGQNTTLAGTFAQTSASATAFAVGRLGATTPGLLVDASTATCVTGLKITPAAAAAGVALVVISSGTNENVTFDAKGSGTITLNATGTGNVVVGSTGAPGLLSVKGTLTGGGLLTNAIQIGSSGPLVYSGSGVPSISAAIKGSLYLRTDGSSTTTRAYIATDTSGTWTAITTSA